MTETDCPLNQCLHSVYQHDASGDEENPNPVCCVPGCLCGRPLLIVDINPPLLRK